MAKKDLIKFIDSLPDSKLIGLPKVPKTGMFTDGTFRLDMQGMTSNKKHNLQIQVSNKPKIPSWGVVAPNTVAGPVLASADEKEWTPEKIREEFKAKIVKFEQK